MTNSDRIEKIKQTVLKKTKSKKKEVQLDKWLEFLKEELKFPFEATIEEAEGGDLRWKDVIKVFEIEGFFDMYGILLNVRKGRRKYMIALCQVEVVEKRSENRFITEAFLEWWTENYC